MANERKDSKEEGSKTFTLTKAGTLPTLERLLGEMASLEQQTVELEKKKEEMNVLIELNKKLKARNHFLERENGNLKLDKSSHSTRSFEYPVKGVVTSQDSSNVELLVLNKRHPVHEDDRPIVKCVTAFIFLLLPTLLGVGVWAACLLHSTDASKNWYEGVLESPLKLPFFVFGGVWCGIYGTLGVGVYCSWYQMGGKRGILYIMHGLAVIVVALAYPPVLIVGHWLLPSIAIIGFMWLLLVLCVMCYSRLSVATGISVLPALFWTSYTVMFTFFPFYDEYFGDKTSAS